MFRPYIVSILTRTCTKNTLYFNFPEEKNPAKIGRKINYNKAYFLDKIAAVNFDNFASMIAQKVEQNELLKDLSFINNRKKPSCGSGYYPVFFFFNNLDTLAITNENYGRTFSFGRIWIQFLSIADPNISSREGRIRIQIEIDPESGYSGSGSKGVDKAWYIY